MGGIQRGTTMPVKKLAGGAQVSNAAATFGVDGHAKKVYHSGN